MYAPLFLRALAQQLLVLHTTLKPKPYTTHSIQPTVHFQQPLPEAAAAPYLPHR